MALDPKYYNSDNSPKWLYSSPGVLKTSTPTTTTPSSSSLSNAQQSQISTIAAASAPKQTGSYGTIIGPTLTKGSYTPNATNSIPSKTTTVANPVSSQVQNTVLPAGQTNVMQNQPLQAGQTNQVTSLSQPVANPTSNQTTYQLSADDLKYLNPSEQSWMLEYKKAFADAQARNDQATMSAMAKNAQTLRASKGYAANADGSVVSQQIGANGTAVLSAADRSLPQIAQDQISQAKIGFADAQAKGDKGGMDYYASIAARVRAAYGNYDAGADGSGYRSLGTPTTKSVLDNIVTKFGSDLGVTDNTNTINAQYEALRTKQLSDLAAALDKSKAVYNQTIAQAPSKYAPIKDQASVLGQQNLNAIREQMAKQGLQNAGENVSGQIAARAATQNSINAANMQQMQEISDAQREIDALQSQYGYQQQSANATVDAARLAALLSEANRLSSDKWTRNVDMANLAQKAEQMGLTTKQVESAIATDNVQRIGLEIDNQLRQVQLDKEKDPNSVQNQTKETQLWLLKQELATANAMAPYAPQEAAAKIRFIEAQIAETYAGANLKNAQADKTAAAFSSGGEGGSSSGSRSGGSSGSYGNSKSSGSSSPKVSGSYSSGNNSNSSSNSKSSGSSDDVIYPNIGPSISGVPTYGLTGDMLFNPLYTGRY